MPHSESERVKFQSLPGFSGRQATSPPNLRAGPNQLSPFHFSDDGIEVDYEPDSGMDTDELAEHYSPLQQPVPPGAVPHHAHTPPVWHHEMEGALPAGADYAHLGLQYEVPEWYHQ